MTGLDDPESKENGNFVVFDFGGATLDVSVLGVENGLLTLLSTVTNFEIGGDMIDQKLVDHFAKEFQRKYKSDLTTSAKVSLCDKHRSIFMRCSSPGCSSF